ncbi:hypothetical protein [Schumannella luteola]
MIEVPTPPRKRGLRWWGWALIALGALAVVAVPAIAIAGIFAYVDHSLTETSPDQPFIDGPAQQPDAQSPLGCETPCFTIEAALLMAVTAEEVAPLSIEDERYGVDEFEPASVASVAPGIGEKWLGVGGDAECAFVPANAPFIAVGADSQSDDPILWIQTWETDDEVMDLAARSFATTEAATQFMLDLHERVVNCPWQDLDIPTAGGLDSSLVQITPQAAIEVPPEVAAVGWTREGTPGPRWRSYTWDLQRGNLVLQVRVLTDGRILEQDVAQYTELLAQRLATLPVPTE